MPIPRCARARSFRGELMPPSRLFVVDLGVPMKPSGASSHANSQPCRYKCVSEFKALRSRRSPFPRVFLISCWPGLYLVFSSRNGLKTCSVSWRLLCRHQLRGLDVVSCLIRRWAGTVQRWILVVGQHLVIALCAPWPPSNVTMSGCWMARSRCV